MSKEPTPARHAFEIPLAISQSETSAELPGRVKPDGIESIFITRANGGERRILSEIETGNFSSLFSRKLSPLPPFMQYSRHPRLNIYRRPGVSHLRSPAIPLFSLCGAKEPPNMGRTSRIFPPENRSRRFNFIRGEIDRRIQSASIVGINTFDLKFSISVHAP